MIRKILQILPTNFRIRLEFKFQDMWIGIHWSGPYGGEWGRWGAGLYNHIWVCFVPMFPIHIQWLATNKQMQDKAAREAMK